jgi:hypothetical protein
MRGEIWHLEKEKTGGGVYPLVEVLGIRLTLGLKGIE